MRQVSLEHFEDPVQPSLACTVFGIDIVNGDHIHESLLSPPDFEPLVFLFSQQMLYKLVAFQTDDPPVGNIPFQFFVLDDLVQPFVEAPHKGFAPFFTHVTEIQVTLEIMRIDLPLVQHGKDKPVGKERFKYFGKVQGEGISAVPRFMQIADQRIQLRMKDFGQDRRIDHRVGIRDQRVDHIVGGTFRALRKLDLLVDNGWKRIVISLPDIAFHPHQGGGILLVPE